MTESEPSADQAQPGSVKNRRESILRSAVRLFADKGVDGASIADIAHHAHVAQGLINYHFGSKSDLVSAILGRWLDMGAHTTSRSGDSVNKRLADVIDDFFTTTGYALDIRRVAYATSQQAGTRQLFADAQQRHTKLHPDAAHPVRDIFRDRGSSDPTLEEAMLRGTLEGIYAVCDQNEDAYLEDARRWAYRVYDLPAPAEPLTFEPAPQP